MTGWASAAVAAVLAVAVTGAPLFAFEDPSIAESSGLVDAGRTVYTINDSGDGPVLYAVDAQTGGTVGTTTYSSGEVVDVEALAPAPDGDVWVADIGDNARERESVAVYRVTPGQGGAPRFELTYPDGARDAETLLAHPGTGRLLVVSKTMFDGAVYAAPRTLDPGRSHRLDRIADVPGLVTDGAFLPDGRHVLLRGYGEAWLLSYPDFGVVGSFDLPEQPQGEAISVGRDGRILLSSEGVGAEVLEVRLPARLAGALDPGPEATPEETPGGSPPVTPDPTPDPTPEAAPDPVPEPAPLSRWVLAGAALALGAAGLLAALRSRRR